MTDLQAILLGLVQGITEFLPISSSGHLVLVEAIMGVHLEEEAGIGFEITVHAGTLLAILIVFRRDVVELVRGGIDLLARVTPTGRARPPRAGEILLRHVILGTLPLVAVAPLLKGLVERAARDPLLGPLLVGFCLLVTAAMLASTHKREDGQMVVTARLAILIGLVQCVAVLPGISRSGSTIVIAMLLGVSRAQAARFSFLLAIPAILGAVVLHVRELLHEQIEPEAVATYGIAFVVAFVSGWLSLLLLIRLVDRGRLSWFAPYCATVGLLALGWCLLVGA